MVLSILSVKGVFKKESTINTRTIIATIIRSGFNFLLVISKCFPVNTAGHATIISNYEKSYQNNNLMSNKNNASKYDEFKKVPNPVTPASIMPGQAYQARNAGISCTDTVLLHVKILLGNNNYPLSYTLFQLYDRLLLVLLQHIFYFRIYLNI